MDEVNRACGDKLGTSAGYRQHYRSGEKPCSACKEAQAAYNADYCAANKEKERARHAAYSAANKEKKREYNAAYRAAWHTTYRSANKEKERARHATYRADNKEKIREYNAAYRAANKDKESARHAAYHANNPGVLRTANKRYRARKRDAYVEDVNALVVAERDGWICRLRKTNIQVTRKHDNKDPWCLEIDHIVPVSRGGEESYANTQCAHRRCNQIKSNGEFSFDRLLKLCAADIEKEL